jgi:hypothetical protein
MTHQRLDDVGFIGARDGCTAPYSGVISAG